jgi:hypothetical protein
MGALFLARQSCHGMASRLISSQTSVGVGLSSGRWVGRCCHAAPARCRDAMRLRLGATADVMAALCTSTSIFAAFPVTAPSELDPP